MFQVIKQTEEEKANALREQALSLTRHIESLKTSSEVSVNVYKPLLRHLENTTYSMQ